MLNKNDLSERCSGVGDVIHNILQLLVREASGMGLIPPHSPITRLAPGLITPTSPAFPGQPWLNGDSGAAAAAAQAALAASSQPPQQPHSSIPPSLSHLISQVSSAP